MAESAPNPPLYAALLSAIHLIIFATLVRLFSARSNRDYAFLAVLAVASMLVSAILTVETGFLIALAIFLVLSVSTFVALEIRRSSVGADSPPFEPGSQMARQLNRALGLTSLVVAGGVLAAGIVIFFIIPRFTVGYLGSLSLQPGLLTGFGDNVALGQIGEIKKNTAVVMRIRVEPEPARAADMHWRGIVLTNFDGHSWSTPSQGQVVIEPNATGEYYFGAPPRVGDRFNPMLYTVLMEPIATDAIFVAPPLETLRGKFGADTIRPGGQPNHGYLFMDRTGSFFNPSHNNSKIRYQGTARIPLIAPAELRAAPADFPKKSAIHIFSCRAISIPESRNSPRTSPPIQTNDYDKAANIQRYLIANYGYTLNLTNAGKDPLAYFLFTSRAGHCEYFATAMTIMLRSIGVPARYATGFLPGEYNDVGGDYIIRGSDAHAWVEVFFSGYGWMTFDPTPPGNEKRGFFSRFGLYWDWFQLSVERVGD